MSIAIVNGIRLSHHVVGEGPLVLLIMGSGSPGRVWRTYQVPALVAAGFRVATVDNRGIAPSEEGADGITLDDLVADSAALIEYLGAPAHVVGTSLGALVAQDLALEHPELVDHAVMMATAGRPHPMLLALNAGEAALHDQDIRLPPQYAAAIKATLNLSPRTLEDPEAAEHWLDMFEFSASATAAPGVRAQLDIDYSRNRLPDYTRITTPSLIIGFTDDQLAPPMYCREVAAAIPGARYVEIDRCGHLGYLERPEEVNRVVIDFLSSRGNQDH
ncbi:alpha/beta fold hydrolase [Nocardia sp. NBC_01009]|uniref:alpha/beta fold hydrolase n=1 Tax=Nocardia sp. NBC_01009 TaxID=2975996 RepID=UPI00386F5BD9|nr:alpha/beta hydrolase [Nocardia sp. NBC_01009]